MCEIDDDGDDDIAAEEEQDLRNPCRNHPEKTMALKSLYMKPFYQTMDQIDIQKTLLRRFDRSCSALRREAKVSYALGLSFRLKELENHLIV